MSAHHAHDATTITWWSMVLESRFARLRGQGFQDLFADIMAHRHPGDFIRTRPWGPKGDEKNDGYLKSRRTLFQVYAPRELTAAQAIKKIKDDFEGALPHWGEFVDSWVFVHNDRDGLGPDVLRVLLELGDQHTEITVSHWGYEELLETVLEISPNELASFLGPAPPQGSARIDAHTQVETPPSADVDILQNLLTQMDSVRRSDDPVQLTLLGHTELQLGRYEHAVTTIRAAIRAGADAADVHNNLGVALMHLNRNSEARVSFEMSVEIDAAGVAAWTNLGVLGMHEERSAHALPHLERAAGLAPGERDVHCNLASCYKRLGRLADAVDEWARALEIDPLHLDALSNRAEALHGLGRDEEALVMADRAIAIGPGHEVFRLRADFLAALGRVREAVAVFGTLDEAIERSRGGIALMNRGAVKHSIGLLEEAIEDYLAALKAEPELDGVHLQLGRLFFESGQIERAVEEYTAGVHRDPDSPDAYYGRAVALAASDAYAEAIADYQKAAELGMSTPQLRNNLGHAFAITGDHESAMSQYALALTESPGYVKALSNSALSLIELGRPNEAVAAMTRVSELEPDSPFVWLDLAEMRFQSGDTDGALKAIDEAVAVGEARKVGDHLAIFQLPRARILAALERFDEAQAATDEAERFDQTRDEARAFRFWILRERHWYEECLDAAEAMLTENPESKLGLYERVLALAGLGRHSAALAALRPALEAGFFDLSEMDAPEWKPIETHETLGPAFRQLMDEYRVEPDPD